MNHQKTRLVKTAVVIILLSGAAGVSYGSGTHAGGHDKKASMSHWSAPPEAMKQINPVKADSMSISTGQKLYSRLCADCHGQKAEGNGPSASSLSKKPTNLREMAGGHADGDFAWKIREGRGDMPAWGEELERTEVWHLVNYIQSLASKP
jgi:mono/diheme cytochrome c family protein